MPSKPKTKRYGRQKPGWTQKAIRIEVELVEALEREALFRDPPISVSALIREILKHHVEFVTETGQLHVEGGWPILERTALPKDMPGYDKLKAGAQEAKARAEAEQKAPAAPPDAEARRARLKAAAEKAKREAEATGQE